MTRYFESLTLVLIVTLAAGCGINNSLGGNQLTTPQEEDAQVVQPAEPLPVGEEETAAINKLQQRGAEIDLDDAQHARIVELVNSKATDDDLKLLSSLPCLESLDITGGKITKAGLVHLRQLPDLQRLYINDLPISSNALENVAEMTKLDVLSLRNTKIGDEGMAHLRKLKALTVLNLSKTKITNNTLKQIRGLKRLDTLVLADTAVTGDGFTDLQFLKNLRTLNVDRCKSVPGNLSTLGGMRELRMLYIKGCSVPQDETDELSDRNPRLYISENE